MTRRLSREQRRELYLRYALEFWEAMEEWYDEHPEATFAEIEQWARKLRRGMMGPGLGALINGRDTGLSVEAPRCARCGQEMVFHGYREKTIRGLEGDTRLERAYYVCPGGCGETLFPPGPETETASGSME
jgi:hypothetical protein